MKQQQSGRTHTGRGTGGGGGRNAAAAAVAAGSVGGTVMTGVMTGLMTGHHALPPLHPSYTVRHMAFRCCSLSRRPLVSAVQS